MSKTYEPVLIRTAIVAALTALLHALVVLGYLPFDEQAEDAVAAVLDLSGTAIAAVWSRAGVVPVAKIEDALSSSEEVIEEPTGEAYTQDTLPGL